MCAGRSVRWKRHGYPCRLVNRFSPSTSAWSTEWLERSCGKAKRLSHNALWFWSWSNITTTCAAIGTTTMASLFIRSFSSYKAEAQIKKRRPTWHIMWHWCYLDWRIHRKYLNLSLISVWPGDNSPTVPTISIRRVKRLSLHTHTHTHTQTQTYTYTNTHTQTWLMVSRETSRTVLLVPQKVTRA